MANKNTYTTKKKYENRNLTTKYEYEQQKMANKDKGLPNLAEMYQATQDEYDAQKRRTAATLQAGNQIMTNLAKPMARTSMQQALGNHLQEMNKVGASKKEKNTLVKTYLDAEKGTPAQTKKTVESKAILPDEQVKKNYTEKLNAYLDKIKKTPAQEYAALDKSQKSGLWNPSKSKALQELTSVDAARKFANEHTYDLKGTQKKLAEWRSTKEEAEKRAAAAGADLEAKRAAMTEEDRKAAQAEAWDLKGKLGVYSMLDRDGLNVSYKDPYGEWHMNETFTKRPDDYYEGNLSEDYNALLYDKIHGEGAYEQRVNNMQTDTDAMRLDNEMDDLWNRLENHTLHEIAEADQYDIKREDELNGLLHGYSTEQRAAESEARYAQDQIDNLESEERFLLQFKEIMGQNPNPEQVGFIPENDRGGSAYNNMADLEYGVRTNDVHRIYSFINRGKEFKSWAGNQTNPRVSPEYSYSLMMNDEQIAKFNDYYNKEQYSEAQKFLDGLQPYLRTLYDDNYGSIFVQETAKQLPIMSSAASLGMRMADTLLWAPREIAGVLGDKSVQDRSSAWYKPAEQAELIEQTIGNEIGGALGEGYRSFMNSARNVLNVTLSAGMGFTGGAQKAAGLLTFAGQIFQESTYKYLKETNDYTKARGLALLDAALETAEEMLPYDTMLKDKGRPVIRFVKNMLSEAGEEFTGATVGEKIKGFITGRDNVQKRADEIYNEGGYYDANGKWVKLDMRDRNMALNKADLQAIKEWHNDIVQNTVGGALGGGFGAVYGGIENIVDTQYKGREIKGPTNTVEGKTGAQRLYEIALTMDEGTKSQKLASKIKTTDGQVQKVGDYQLGRLAKAIAEDTGNKYNETIKATIERDAKQKLTAAGVPDAQAQVYAEIMARDMISSEPMNNQDLKTLARDKRAVDIYRGYTVLDTMKDLQQEIKTETKPQVSIMDTISEMLTPRTASSSAAAADVEEAIKATKSQAEAMDYLVTKKAYLVSEKFAETAKRILEKNETAKNSKNFVDDAMKIMLAAQSLEENMPKVQMDEEAAKELWDEAKAEFDKKEAQRIQAQQPAVPGKGTAEFDGAEYGTEEWTAKLKDLSKTLRNQIGAVGEIATRMGLKVGIINDTNRTNVYGYEMKDGTITLNAAGLNRNGMNHHMLTTMAHEMTHWLEQNSAEGYKDLRTFALDSLRKEGKDIAKLMVQTINNHNAQLAETGETLDMNGAMAEIVAKSCENILSSQEMANALKDVNPSLYNKVKTYVKNFVARLNAAIQGMDASLSAEALALKKYTDDIAKLWLKASNEAWKREAPAKGQRPEEGVQFSIKEGNKKGSPSAAADSHIPASTSETTDGITSTGIVTQDEDIVKREKQIDEEYLEAVRTGNKQKQLQMIREKLMNTEGIYPFYAPQRHVGKAAHIANLIKKGDAEAIQTAAKEMAEFVPDNAVLIPMPNHNGVVTEDMDTMKLAKAISEITGAPVYNVLAGESRESRHVAKLNRQEGVTAEQMGMRQTGEIPEGSIPMIVDNVVAVGETAKAAIKAIRNSSVLAYTKGQTEKVTTGLKAGFTTTDLEGNVIPLSKKGDINNPNWRYSIMEDSEGKQLTKEQQEFFKDSKAVNSKGQLIKLYHGTKHAGFNTFENKKGIYWFTDSSKTARTYSGIIGQYAPKYGEEISSEDKYLEEQNGAIYAVYLNMTNPITINARGSDWQNVTSGKLKMTTDEWAKRAKKLGYDGLIIYNVRDNGDYKTLEDTNTSNVYVVFSPNQIKSVNNTEPTEASNDIRFSLANEVEERQDGLVAVHNLGEAQLLKVFRLGGFAMPSIAIIKAKEGHSKYGNISVVFGPDTIDPKAYRTNKVYGGDAWTPTYPKVEYKLNRQKLDNVRQKVIELLPEQFKRANLVDLYEENLSRYIDEKADFENAIGSEGKKWLRIAYMLDNNKEIEYPTKTANLSDRWDNYQVIHIANMLGRELVEEATSEDPWKYAIDHPELVEKIRTALNDLYREQLPDNSRFKKLDIYNERNYGPSSAEYILRGAQKYFQKGLTETTDLDTLNETLRKTIDEKDFKNWVNNVLFSGVVEKSGIRNNKEYYTRTGNQRSWEQLHDEENLDNVIRIMREQDEKGENAFFGQSAILARGTRNFNSLDEIREHEDQLKLLNDEDYSNLKTNIIEQFGALADRLADKNESNYFIARDRVYDAIADAVKSSKTVTGITKAMNEWGYRLTTDQANTIVNLMEEIANLPTGYFEAKPQRAVGIDEIVRVILPENTSQELKDALDNWGVSYDTYDGTEEDRLKKLNAVKGVQFSIADGPDYDVERFMRSLNEDTMRSEQEKVMVRQFKQINQTRESYQFFISDLEGQIRKIRKKVSLTPEEDIRHAELTAKMTKGSLTPEEVREYKRLSHKAELSVYDREQISKKQSLIDEYKRKIEKVDKEYIRVTRNEGYARLMQKNRTMMDDLLTGLTADKLQNTVQAMERQLNDVTAEMNERKGQLDKLAEAEAVLRIRTQFNHAGLRKIATELKENLASDLDEKEIENRLALIALKMKQGKMDNENVQELADMLMGGMKTQFEGTVIDALRGSTITLGKGQLKELEGTGSSLKEVRDILTGTGIRIGTKGNTTLDEKWSSLCDIMPDLDRNANSGDQLNEILKRVKAEKRESGADIWTDENKMKTAEAILNAANKLLPEIIQDENSRKLMREVLQYVHELSQETKETAEAMTDITALIDRLTKSSKTAVSQANTLTGDINAALDYYNKLSLQSEAAMWKQERVKLIEQMKSDNTKALLEERDKWKEKIEKDKNARGIMQNNMQMRKSITTNISRLKTRLINETDQKNITEHMKNLARELLGTIVDNDLYGRKITGIDHQDLMDIGKTLGTMERMDGRFTLDDLKLIHDEEAQSVVEDALADLEDGIREYNEKTGGKDLITNLTNFNKSLAKIYKAVTTISKVITAENSLNYMDRTVPLYKAAYAIKDAMSGSRFKGELAGRGSKALHTFNRAVILGNTTPEYFFKNLRNGPLAELWNETKKGENRNGLELQKAKDYLGKLAADTHYADWANDTRTISLGGQKVNITIGNVMELYAIWRRELTENPEMSSHIEKGGVFFENNANQEGWIRRDYTQQKARRLSDMEIMDLYNSLTQEQKNFLDKVVSYLSNDMSALGNEASMRMYGIEKYKESYYFPMKIWDGVRSARSDKGITGTDENRAAHKSWSKRRINKAKNPLVIGDFMTDAVNHIVEMINYNTMAPAIENINKVLNLQLPEIAEDGEEDMRNIRIMFQEAYGRDALNYLETLLKDMNGGVTQDQRKTLRDILLSTFKKNAVAGSLSVAAQQPLSYIRAAMMINPVYLAEGLGKDYLKGAYKELLKYSGVAVLKQAGKFDMNYGSSAKEYITPEAKQGKLRTAINWLGEKSTALPEKMDAWTWTRMWVAVKAEQHAQHKNMDVKSDEFLKICADRFNEIMRRTQVYDSVLVKSANMRSTNTGMKIITSFMAEPTLSLNVLADAWVNLKEKGGKANAAKALATFMLSAAAQAGAKAFFSTGRSPDKKKTGKENYLYKLAYNLISEANPIGLIPGYSSIIDTLINGELTDNSMSVLAKAKTAADNLLKLMQGGEDMNLYRTLEDSLGQLVQIASNVPAKNIMRDFRAMVNIFSGGQAQGLTGNSFAQRETSNAVLKYQLKDLLATEDVVGLLNKSLGEAGYQTSTEAYYKRMYEADKAGKKNIMDEIAEYIKNAKLNEPKKGTKDDVINSKMRGLTKTDDSLTYQQKIKSLRDKGMANSDITSWLTTEYKEGNISKTEAAGLYAKANPEMTENDIYWKLDLMDYEKETGKDASGKYYRLKDAMEENREASIKAEIKRLTEHGVEAKNIKSTITSEYKDKYLKADQTGRRRIRDAMEKAYKAMGLKAEDADKIIEGWIKESKKKKTK